MSKIVAGVFCVAHGAVGLIQQEYERQLRLPDALWVCPVCFLPASFDDVLFDVLPTQDG